MKKVFLIVLSALSTIGMINAQDCMTFFPTTKGATMENKTYDAQDNLLITTTYTVGDAYEHFNGENAEIAFTSKDVMGQVVDQGMVEASCQNGNFYLKSLNRNTIPDCDGIVLQNIDLMGSFLDYPNTFNTTYPYDNTFEMDGAEFTLKNKETGEFKRVRVYNRNYEGNEKITVPAGDYHASKITYTVEVFDSETDDSKTYKGVEWYTTNAGIIRSQIMDENDNLQAYSVMTAISDMEDE